MTASGPDDQIIRHVQQEGDFRCAPSDEDACRAVVEHFDQHIGEAPQVLHELVSENVHIDVHPVPPSDERPYWTLFTTGMSDLPMKTPQGLEDFKYAELMIKLPADWPIDEENFKVVGAEEETEEWYWPIRWLKMLARLPHHYNSWLWKGHTVPNGDPPEPYARNTKFCCMLIGPPMEVGADFGLIHARSDKVISVFALFPLFNEEVELKLKKGADALYAAFEKHGIGDVVDLRRRNCAGPRKKRFGFF